MRTPQFDRVRALLVVARVSALCSLAGGVACRLDGDGMRGAPAVTPAGIDPDEAPGPARGDAGASPAIADASWAIETAPVSVPDAVAPAVPDAAADEGDAAVDPQPVVDAAPAPPPPVAIAPPARCAVAAPLPVPVRRMGLGPSSDDITFDRDGHLIAFDRRQVVRVLTSGAIEILARDAIGQRGGALRALPSGDLLLADFERDVVVVQDPTGQLRPLPTPVVAPMKMVRGPHGTVYVTGKGGIVYRIDGSTGAVSPAATTNHDLGGLTFSLDYKILYVAATDTDTIDAFDVQSDGSLGAPRMWREQVQAVSALATDECGSIYLLSENDGRVRRIKDGAGIEVLADLNQPFVWSLAFGSGKQGWSASALYVLTAGAGPLFELSVGVGDQPAPPDGAPADVN
jgi:hypothetical protein